MINFHTANLSFRYGLAERVNLNATLPWLSIESSKVQGAPYDRVNRGFGDLTTTVELAILTSPQWTVETGFKLATGSEDERDDLGQRIDDILALGSGTTDFVIGSSIWIPLKKVFHLDLMAGVQHRFVGGQNKWGYQFGDQTTFYTHLNRKMFSSGRLGLRAEGYHTSPDEWVGHQVPERGATMLYLGPTASWDLNDALTLGGFARFPVMMNLEGSQMVAPSIVGLEFSSNITSLMSYLTTPLGGE